MSKFISILQILEQLSPAASAEECLAYSGGAELIAADIERQQAQWRGLEQLLSGDTEEHTAYLSLEFEEDSQAYLQKLAGCDEAGRGPLAGPLAAAAVILPYGAYIPGLRDSKQLSHEERLAMVPWIKAAALAYAVTEIGLDELNAPTANINSLSLLGMKRSLRKLGSEPSYVIIDGRNRLPGWSGPQKALIKGDDRCPAVAAASVLAKVHRDLIMIEADRRWPQYGFAENKGYGTEQHLLALSEHGPCPWHRRNYRPVAEWRDQESI